MATFGRWAGTLERGLWADDRTRGAAFAGAALLPVLAGGVALERATGRRTLARVLVTAAATWAVLGARTLAAEGRAMARHLEDADLPAARGRLPHLCGRTPDGLDEPDLARATVESLAENTSDAVVASLFWGAVAGVPGLLGHRAVNTLDAMVGHRSARHARFGTASARLDDLAGLAPARLTGVLACALAPVVGGSPLRAARTMLRDHARHPSPNGGWCEAAWAGALGVRLGGRNVYGSRVEVRGTLGEGDRPDASGVWDAARLVTAVTVAATGLAVAATLARAASGGAR